MNETAYPFITRKLQQAIENGSTPGVALLVDRAGELLYRHAVGYAQQYPDHRDLKDDTIFDLSSLTNVVATATAVMLLMKSHQIDLDAPIHRYLPDFPYRNVTITHLLTHSSGLPSWMPLYEEIPPDLIGSSEAKALMLKQLCQIALLAKPGEQYAYSDLGFLLSGYVIERITGTTLDQYCQAMILAPLGMTRTFFRKHNEPLRPGEYAATERCEWRHRILYGEVHDELAYAVGGAAGHAGLFSTLDDVRSLMNTLRACYEGQHDFLPAAQVRKFFTRQNIVAGSTRALGWDTPAKPNDSCGELLSEHSVGHTGVTGVSIWLDLERKLLTLLFSNRIHPSRHNHTFFGMRPKIHDTVVITIDRLETEKSQLK